MGIVNCGIAVAGAITLFSVAVNAIEQKSEPRMANHSFDYGTPGMQENPGIEVLDYRYGDSGLPGTRPSEQQLSTGHIDQVEGGIHGGMPVGPSLYVKWRVLSTGKVYEDTVDLLSRLPPDMEGKTVHFAVTDSRLLVYVIEGNVKANLHGQGKPDCPPPEYAGFQCTRIYPDHWKNF